jgi:cell division septal protein FtsQ
MSATRNPNLGPSHMHARKRRLFLIRFYIILFFVFVIVFGLAIFSGNEKVKIQTVIVSGNAAVSSDTVLAIANRDMAGRYWYLFSRSNSLIFPRFQIKKDLLREIKTISDVSISWDNWQQISIFITERRPHSVWCGNDMRISESCFFVDKYGYIYSEAPTFSGSIFIKDYGNVSTSTSAVGQYFLSRQTYSKVFNLIDNLDKNNIKVVAVSFDGTDFRFVLESGPTIVFTNKDNFDPTFQNFFTAIETKNLDLDAEADIISYIDLRFDNKIVVGKKQNEDKQ